MIDLINEAVSHILFGEGVIIEQRGKIIKVEFTDKTSSFVYPDSFKKFLKFKNESLTEEALKEIEIKKKPVHMVEEVKPTVLKMPDKKNKVVNTPEKLSLDKLQPLGRPRLIVCRLAYMKYYNGITDDDHPSNGGSYVNETGDAYEKNNFHIYEDDFCYGFAETKYKNDEARTPKAISLEQIDYRYCKQEEIDDVRVVFVAFDYRVKKTLVVGWYDNATVYRHRIITEDKNYMIKCKSTDAHLIPHEQRLFEVPKASTKTYGIGQSNYWYIQKYPEARELEDRLVDYLDNLKI